MKNLHFGLFRTVKRMRFSAHFGSWHGALSHNEILGSWRDHLCLKAVVATDSRAAFFDRWGCMRNHTSFDRLTALRCLWSRKWLPKNERKHMRSTPIEPGRNRGQVAGDKGPKDELGIVGVFQKTCMTKSGSLHQPAPISFITKIWDVRGGEVCWHLHLPGAWNQVVLVVLVDLHGNCTRDFAFTEQEASKLSDL